MTRIKSYLDYIGAKTKLAPTIAETIESHTGIVNGFSFADLFAGTGAMSRWFLHNRKMKSITTNDFEVYSTAVCLATTRQIVMPPHVYSRFNDLPGFDGFITNTCSPSGYAGRMFFTDENARLIDGIRFHIKNMYDEKTITIDQAIKLVGELTVAADKVSNTASVYGAYLKKFKATALKRLEIKPLQPDTGTYTQIWNTMLDANDAILDLKGDILYIDPPYTSRQYGNNYHVLTYIADLWSEGKYTPQGVTGVYKGWQRSMYCNKKKVAERLDHLIKNANFDLIAFSYNNRGILPLTTLKMIFQAHAEILEIKQIEYKNFKADRSRTYDAEKTTEYIIVMRKGRSDVQYS